MARKEELWMRMDDDDVLEKCWRCGSGRAHASNAICFCDFCGYGVHQRCDSAPLGQFLLPGENDEWVCGFCRQKSSAAKNKWRKILAAYTPQQWKIFEHQPLQLLNDDGPSPDYRYWVSTMLKRNTDFITLFGWFDMFGDVVGTGKLSFQDLDQLFAAPTSSGILREVHVQLLTCAGKKPHRDTWFRTLLDFIEDNEEAFSDATKLAKALSAQKAQAGLSAAARAASALAEALEDEEDVPLGSASAGNSSSGADVAEAGPAEEDEETQQKRMWGAEARKAARAARDAAQGTHGIIAGTRSNAKARGTGSTGGDSESDSEGEASDSEGGRDWNYFTLPVLVRVSLLRCLCDELLCIDTKSNKKLADFLRVKVATRDTATVPEGEAGEKGESSKGGKGKAGLQKVEKEEDEAMAPEQLRAAIQPIAQVPLYTSSSLPAVQSSDQPPVPDYVHTLEHRARQRGGDTVAGLAGEDVDRPTVPPGRVYHLPSYLADAALAASPCNTVHSGSTEQAPHVALELLHSPRRKESRMAAASSTAGTASLHTPLSTVLAVPRSILSVQPLPANRSLPPGAKDAKEEMPRGADQGKKRKGRAVIDDDEDEERQAQGEQSPEAELSDVEELKDDTSASSDVDMDQDEEALPELPQDAEDARAMRYYFFEDTTGAFRLIRMKADLPLECPPGSLHARKHLVLRAQQAAQATVRHEQVMKQAAEEARARAEAEEIAAKLAAEKAVADAEARRKAFFKVAGIAAPHPAPAPSLPAPLNDNTAADIVVVDAAEPVQGEVLTVGSKRPAAEMSAGPFPSPPAAPLPSLPPPVPNPVSAAPHSTAAAATQDAKKAKTTAASKAQPPPGQKTLFQMFSKPKAVPAAEAAASAGLAAPVPTPSPPAVMASSAGTASSCTPVQPSATPQLLLTVAPVPAESASCTVSTADVETAMKADKEAGSRSVSPAVPIPQELKQTEAAADDSDVMLVDSPLQSVPATTACTGTTGLAWNVHAGAGGVGMEGKAGKRKPAAKAAVQPETTVPQLEVLQQLPGLVYTSIPASSLPSMDSSPLAGLSTVATLADSLPALEGVIAELSQSTSLWERHVAKRLQADALPRARALMKRSERQKRRTVADLSSWAYQPSSTAAAPAREGAYAGRTRGKRPVSYDVDAALDKILGVA